MRIHFYFTWGYSLVGWSKSGLLDRERHYFRKLVEKGNEVVLITYGDRNDLDYQSQLPGVQIYPLYTRVKSYKSTFLNLINLVGLLFKERRFFSSADVVRTNQIVCGPLPILAALLFRRPLVARAGYEPVKNFSSHGDMRFKLKRIHVFVSLYINSLFAYVFSRHILCSTEEIKRFICKVHPVSPRKISVLPNYINTEIFYPDRKLWGRATALYVGRISEEKNLDVLLPALNACKLSLTVVGDGPRRASLAQKASELGVNVEFLPVQENSDLAVIYRSHSIFFLPSIYEGNPKVLLEAMACGSVPICSDIPANRNIVEHLRSGFLCGRESEEYARSISTLLGDPNLHLRFSERGASKISSNNNIQAIVGLELEIFSKLQKSSFT